MYDKTPVDILTYHHSMLLDWNRTEGYLQAVLHTVRPGDVVLDIGSGTGILALFACLAGARHVYAVEQGPVIEIARRVVRDNGYQERVTFVKDWSTNVELPQLVDVLITETIGNAGFEEGILGWVVDAKKRLLAQGGRIIPSAVELVVVPVESQVDYDYVEGWLKDIYSFDFSAAGTIAANNLHWTELSSQSFLSEPLPLARVELAAVESEDVRGTASFVMARDGLLHGIGGWFVADLIPGVRLSNAPPNQTPSWTHGLLPLERPTPVSTGDRLRVEIQAKANSAQWGWQVTQDGDTIQEVGLSTDTLRPAQTTLSGQLVPLAYENGLNHKPARTQDAEVDLFILQLMDGVTPIEEIARQTAARFPTHFASIESTLSRVQSICEHYGCWTGTPSTVI